MLRPSETASRGGWCCAGALVGFGFLTKMLQALLVCPRSRSSTCVAAPSGAVAAASATARCAGARDGRRGRLVDRHRRAVAGRRRGPYIGGSQTNSILELTFGYNGFGRLTGNEVAGVRSASDEP